MLGMDIAMDRANLVRKDIESNVRDTGHYIMKWGALRQQMTWHIFGKSTATSSKKQTKSTRKGAVETGTNTTGKATLSGGVSSDGSWRLNCRRISNGGAEYSKAFLGSK
jgi:hypothetical protein